jgi:hypothetical protein
MRNVVLFVLGLALGSCGGRRPEGLPADTVLIHGKIAIVDDAFTVVEALAIRDGKVAAAGTTREIEALRGDGTRVIDLKGRTVLPGFYDSHLRVRADPPRSVDLGGATRRRAATSWGIYPGCGRRADRTSTQPSSLGPAPVDDAPGSVAAVRIGFEVRVSATGADGGSHRDARFP